MQTRPLWMFCLLALLGAAIATAQQAPPPPGAPQPGPIEAAEHLLGAWRMAEIDGELIPPDTNIQLQFMVGGQFRVVLPGGEARVGNFALVGLGQLSITIDGNTHFVGAALDPGGRLELQFIEGEIPSRMLLTPVGP